MKGQECHEVKWAQLHQRLFTVFSGARWQRALMPPSLLHCVRAEVCLNLEDIVRQTNKCKYLFHFH